MKMKKRKKAKTKVCRRDYHSSCIRRSIANYSLCASGPPAAKKQKTKPATDEKATNGDKEDEEDEDEEEEEEEAEGTAKTSGPAAAAAKAKGDVVPKEADLAEIDDDEDEE